MGPKLSIRNRRISCMVASSTSSKGGKLTTPLGLGLPDVWESRAISVVPVTSLLGTGSFVGEDSVRRSGEPGTWRVSGVGARGGSGLRSEATDTMAVKTRVGLSQALVASLQS